MYLTNGSYSAGVAGVFGPGSIGQAHAIDEFLEVSELKRALRAYQVIAKVVGRFLIFSATGSGGHQS